MLISGRWFSIPSGCRLRCSVQLSRKSKLPPASPERLFGFGLLEYTLTSCSSGMPSHRACREFG
jgi:hypothetical protein